MKKQVITLVITLSVVLSSVSNSFAFQNTNTNLDITNTNEVVNVLNKKAKKIVKKNAKQLETYIAVMDLYNNAPASFYNLDEQTQQNFFLATAQLNESLSNTKKKDLKKVASQVRLTSAVSNYIWSVKKSTEVILPLEATKSHTEKSI